MHEIEDLYLVNEYDEIVKGRVWKSGTKDVVIVKAGQYSLICTPDHVFKLNTGEECKCATNKHRVSVEKFWSSIWCW